MVKCTQKTFVWMLVTQIGALARTPVYYETHKQTFKPNLLEDEALFGYSASYVADVKSIIISAPREGGTGYIYTCNINEKLTLQQSCVKTNFDLSNNTADRLWLGAQVKSGTSYSVTCAPRFISYNKYYKRYGTFAKCFYADHVANNAIILNSWSSAKNGKHRSYKIEGDMTSFGWSIEISNNTILTGGPAMRRGQVQIHHINSLTQANIDLIPLGKDQVNYNFGYAIASGNFFKSTIQTYAVSSPYGTVGRGKVLFFDRTIYDAFSYTNEYIEDSEVGSLFGASLLSANFGGTRHCLLVGAPGFVPGDHGGAKIGEQVGAVFIYEQREGKMQRFRSLTGYQNMGYFGHTMGNIGDLDGDWRDEIAISAPYEDEGQGAVYIYSGADLVKSDDPGWIQRLSAGGGPPHQNFGLSLNTLMDYDDNGCNELAVGIPGINSVVVYRCVSSITVTVTADLLTANKNRPIDLYVEPGDTDNKWFKLPILLKVLYPMKPQEITSDIILTTTLVHPYAKIHETNKSKSTYNIGLKDRSPIYCFEVLIKLPNNGDYDQPLQFTVSASLSKDPMTQTVFDKSLVVFNDASRTSISGELKAEGSELHLDIQTSMRTNYTIGSTQTESLTITLGNSRNIAHNACVRVRIQGVTVAEAPPECALIGDVFVCKPKKALHKNDSMIAVIYLRTKSLTSNSSRVIFEAEAYTRCAVSQEIQTNKTITVALLRDDKGLLVKGSSIPSIVNVTKTDVETGIRDIKHVYTILNKGVTHFGKLTWHIRLPSTSSVISSINCSPATVCKSIDEGSICELNALSVNNEVQITISMEVPHGSPVLGQIRKSNATIYTELMLDIDGKTVGVTTTILYSSKLAVPLWIMVVASLITLIIVIVVALLMYECGFLRRKRKEDLVALKRDVRRQSKIIRQEVTDNINQTFHLDE